MAMETITAHLKTQFSDMMHEVQQQTQPRLKEYCRMVDFKGDDLAYDGIGTVEAREYQTRNAPVIWDDIEHFRRQMTKRRFGVVLPMDRNDLEGRLTDPQGDYAKAVTNAMNRAFDLVVYQSMFADVKTGRTFTTTTTFSGEGGLTVNATGGLTVAKLLEIKQNFIDNEVGNESPVKIGMGISGDENTTLLQIATLTSGDYSRRFQLEGGEIKQAVGIDFIVFGDSVNNPVLAVAAGVRTSFAMATGAIAVGMVRGFEIEIQKRTDFIDTEQLVITGVWGALRTEAKLIQKVTTTT